MDSLIGFSCTKWIVWKWILWSVFVWKWELSTVWAVFGIGWKWITVWKWILDRFSLFGNGFLIGFCLEMDSLIGFPRSVHLDLLLLSLFLVTGNCSSVHELREPARFVWGWTRMTRQLWKIWLCSKQMVFPAEECDMRPLYIRVKSTISTKTATEARRRYFHGIST